MLCGGIVDGSPQPPERGALPREGNQGDEWDAYVVVDLERLRQLAQPWPVQEDRR